MTRTRGSTKLIAQRRRSYELGIGRSFFLRVAFRLPCPLFLVRYFADSDHPFEELGCHFRNDPLEVCLDDGLNRR